MQAKGLVRVFAIALAVVCLYQLSFTWIISGVETEAEEFAQELAEKQNITETDSLRDYVNTKKQEYLDSISNETVYDLFLIDFTYRECKELELNLGLDLQGGMSVVLQVSLEEMIKNIANNPNDPTLTKAIEIANQKQKDSQEDYITLLGEAITEANPNAQFSTIFSSRDYKDQINYNTSNEEVLTVLRNEADFAIRRTFNILRTRIDKFGVSQPNITLQEGSGRISVELPGVKDPERVRKLLQSTAKLEFWETYENREVVNYLFQANDALAAKLSLNDSSEATDSATEKTTSIVDDLLGDDSDADTDTGISEEGEDDLLGLLEGDASGDSLAGDSSVIDELSTEDIARRNPLFAVLSPAVNQTEQGAYPVEGPIIGYAQGKDIKKINNLLQDEVIKASFPRNLKLRWSSKPINPENDVYALYAIKGRLNDTRPPLGGEVIVDARQDFDQNNQVEVTMKMNSEGARIWKRLTAEAAGDPSNEQDNKSIAIVLDNYVYSAPRVSGEISGGRSSISGNFDINEGKDLANILKAGKLPAPARIVEEEIVGPSLGQESIDAGLKSLVAGLALVLVFMIIYYNGGGIVANVAVLFNLFFIIGILSSMGATLTLPGIAGIVLTIGMSVDANVLIFERIKEELLKGKGLRLAISDGYKNSISSIIDANLTTLLTGIILAFFGSGPILGFATVLVIGILSSLFTAILITRLIIEWYLGKDRSMAFSAKATQAAFKNLNLNIIGNRKIGYIISSIIIVAGIASFMTKGFDLGVDFKGGRTYVVRFDQPVNTADVRNSLNETFKEFPIVKTFGSENQVKINTAYLIDDKSNEADSIVEASLYKGVQSFLGDDVSFDTFLSEYKMSSQKVGPTIADDIKVGAVWATLFALLGIFIYLLIRFKKWQYGLGAVAALFHDTVFVLAIFSIFSGILPFSLEIDQAFIAAILTVIGYSINDTVVVFDRIREYLIEHPKMAKKEIYNLAINSTLSRTLVTSITTLLVVVVLFLFGGEVIRGFSFALLIGVVVGTYSSIFIASPIVADLDKSRK